MRRLSLVAQAILFSAACHAATPNDKNYDAFVAATAKQQQEPGNALALRHGVKAQRVARGLASVQGYKGQLDKTLGAATVVFAKSGASSLAKMSPLNPATAADTQARAFLKGQVGTMSLDRQSVDQALLIDSQNSSNGPQVLRYRQQINGIEVYGRQVAVLLSKTQQPVAASGYFAPVPKTLSKEAATLSPKDALLAAWHDQGLALDASQLSEASSPGRFSAFNYTASQHGDQHLAGAQHVRAIWYPLADGSLRLAYQVIASGESADGASQSGFGYVIDAANGKVLARNNLVAYEKFNYYVYGDENGPYDGPLGNDKVPFTSMPSAPYDRTPGVMNDISLEHGPISTGDPWLASGATETKGNNTDAYLDLDGVLNPDGSDGPNDGFTPNSADFRAQTNGANSFHYAHVVDGDPTTTEARNAAIVNLFYINNWLHDFWYDHGFNEEAGNAQQSNYGRGGEEGDPLLSEGQDASSTDNANMFTPPDGISPRMQMYLFSARASGSLTSTADDQYSFGVAYFGPQSYELEAPLAYYMNNGQDNACNAPDNPGDIPGHIALINRGSCDFTVKVANAQAAGAVGVVVINSADSVINMSGSDQTLTIPAMSVNITDGLRLRYRMQSGEAISLHMKRDAAYPHDGTLDNGIIAHEYFHHISSRLIGDGNGLTNQQGGGMGEGWSDFAALLLEVRPEDKLLAGNEHYQGAYSIGGYVLENPYFGIRRYPYSTDLNVNPLTLRYIEANASLPQDVPTSGPRGGSDNPEVHNLGEVWASALWEVYAALLNDPRYDFASARARMQDYLIAGLKLTPVMPTFLEARDALLAVALATDEQDFQLMAQAFAKRGMGVGAVVPDRASVYLDGVKESFVAFAGSLVVDSATIDFSFEDGSHGWIDNDGVLDPGETARLTVTLTNQGTSDITVPVTAHIESDAKFSFPDGNQLAFAPVAMGEQVSASMLVTLDSASEVAQKVDLSVLFDESDTDTQVILMPDTLQGAFYVNYDVAPHQRDMEDLSEPEILPFDWQTELTGGVFTDKADSIFRWTADPSWGDYYSTGTAWWGQDPDAAVDSSLETPEVTVGSSNFTFNWEQWFEFEAAGYADVDGQSVRIGWDGGVVEISINGGQWQDVLAAGGTFTQGNGYNGRAYAFNGNNDPTLMRPAYVFYDDGYPGYTELNPMQLSFGTALAGDKVKFRFRIASDGTGGATGWVVDNIHFEGITDVPFSAVVADDGVVENRPPHFTSVPDPITANALTYTGQPQPVTLAVTAIDADNDTLIYQWLQTGGDVVTLSDPGAATVTFTPDNKTQQLTFEVTVSDGQQSISSDVVVNMKALSMAEPAEPSSSGGGGAFSPLLLLPLLLRGRGKRKLLALGSGLLAALALPVQAAGQAQNLAQLPLSFEQDANQGFVAKGQGYRLTLNQGAAKLLMMDPKSHNPSQIQARLLGASMAGRGQGEGLLGSSHNYLMGNDPRTWRRQVPSFQKVRYKDIYAGIDLVYYGKQQLLEYDFVVAPGADPQHIALSYQGLDGASIDDQGDLLLSVAGKTVRLEAPVTYQMQGGERQLVASHYQLRHQGDSWVVGFEVGEYDPSRQLVIDPVLKYASFYGAEGADNLGDMAIAANGDILVTGWTTSTGLGTEGSAYPEPYDMNSNIDGYVSRFSADGQRLIYTTYLGGDYGDWLRAIAVDKDGNAYVTGWTCSDDYPQVNAFQGPPPSYNCLSVLSKLSADGSQLLYSTYYGSPGAHGITDANDLVVDDQQRPTIVGITGSPDLVLQNPIKASLSGRYDGFVARFTADGQALDYASYIGGNYQDYLTRITLGTDGSLYLAGSTASTDLPVLNAYQSQLDLFSYNDEDDEPGEDPYYPKDAFLMKLSTDGSQVQLCTYFGGSNREEVSGLGLDGAGNIYLAGSTASFIEFPLLHSNKTQVDSSGDVYLAKFTPQGELVFATVIGGYAETVNDPNIGESLGNIKVTEKGDVLLAGTTKPANFPVVNPPPGLTASYTSQDIFVMRLGAVDNANPQVPTIIWSTRFGSKVDDLTENTAINLSPDGDVILAGNLSSGSEVVLKDSYQSTFDGDAYTAGDLYLVKIGESEPESDQLAFVSAQTQVDATQPGTVTLAVSRAGNTAGTISLPWNTVDGSAVAGRDYQAASGTLQWAPGDTATKLIEVEVMAVEGNRDFQVALQAPLATGTNVALGEVSTVTVTLAGTPEPQPAAPVSSGGGGSAGFLTLLLLALRRRR